MVKDKLSITNDVVYLQSTEWQRISHNHLNYVLILNLILNVVLSAGIS